MAKKFWKGVSLLGLGRSEPLLLNKFFDSIRNIDDGGKIQEGIITAEIVASKPCCK